MTDRLDPLRRSRLMQKVRAKDTGPERQVRSILHRLGYRFRLHRKDLPGTPDIVFARRHVVLFVHGCFWHAHGCRKGQPPKSRLEYWGPKLEANRQRDRRNIEALTLAGWHVEVIWQCELSDQPALVARLNQILAPAPS
jgi:DNA mismatch endonuclease, patch repair protein